MTSCCRSSRPAFIVKFCMPLRQCRNSSGDGNRKETRLELTEKVWLEFILATSHRSLLVHNQSHDEMEAELGWICHMCIITAPHVPQSSPARKLTTCGHLQLWVSKDLFGITGIISLPFNASSQPHLWLRICQQPKSCCHVFRQDAWQPLDSMDQEGNGCTWSWPGRWGWRCSCLGVELTRSWASWCASRYFSFRERMSGTL